MRSILLQVDPKRIKHDDLPVDSANSADIEKQAIAWNGIHTPVEVWIKDDTLRKAVFDDPSRLSTVDILWLMDGFHRTEVAERLKYPTIAALLYDCTEDEFWDKRISQARKHHAVEGDRLHTWIVSSWQQSEFKGEQSFANMIQGIHAYLTQSKHAHLPKGGKLLLDWFYRKADLWGRPAVEICSIILRKEQIYDPRAPEVQRVVSELGLNGEQAKTITAAVVKSGRLQNKLSKTDLKQYAKDLLQAQENPLAEAKSLQQWKEEKDRQRVIQTKREEQRRDTPAGAESRKKQRIFNGVLRIRDLSSVETRIDNLLATDLSELLMERPEQADKLQRFFGKVKKLSEKANVELAVGITETELISLRKRVADLERQLSERPAQPVVVPETVLAHSSLMFS